MCEVTETLYELRRKAREEMIDKHNEVAMTAVDRIADFVFKKEGEQTKDVVNVYIGPQGVLWTKWFDTVEEAQGYIVDGYIVTMTRKK